MSKIATAVILVLTAGLFFGIGYRTAYVPPPALEFQPLPQQASEEELDAVAQQVADTLAIVNPLERAEKLSALLQTLGADNITAVRRAFDTVFLDIRDLELRLLAVWWVEHDAESAFRWTQVNWTGSTMLVEVMRAWAARDPQAAKAALPLIATNPSHLHRCLMALAHGWDESGQPGLGEFIQSMSPGPNRQRVIATITRRMVLRDGIEKTTEWLVNLPEDEPPDRFKLQSYRRVASAIASVDALEAARWAEIHGQGKYGSGVYKRVVVRWAQKDGPAAMTWLSTLPDGEDRDWAVREGFRRWVGVGREQAFAWIAELPAERWSEPARVIYAGSLSRQDPRAGIALAETLSEPTLRDETLESIAKAWVGKEPDEARAWIAASDLTDMAKARASAGPKVRKRRAPRPDRDIEQDLN
jgi:hypothetical protein